MNDDSKQTTVITQDLSEITTPISRKYAYRDMKQDTSNHPEETYTRKKQCAPEGFYSHS
jgi:hypothetical protein